MGIGYKDYYSFELIKDYTLENQPIQNEYIVNGGDTKTLMFIIGEGKLMSVFIYAMTPGTLSKHYIEIRVDTILCATTDLWLVDERDRLPSKYNALIQTYNNYRNHIYCYELTRPIFYNSQLSIKYYNTYSAESLLRIYAEYRKPKPAVLYAP